jgi:hypothetical protein
MVFGGVGAGDEDDVGLSDVGDGVGHRATSECCGQTGHGGAVSETGAMVDVVRLQHRPGEFVGDIVFFVGDPGRGQHPDGVAAVGVFDLPRTLATRSRASSQVAFLKLAVF